ncbi:MAG: hypothetical protein IJS46_04490, partial [Kiritimatiellae bacterium]|nr:hypothetical protein [Kiritimatiellia bacterium]
GLRAEMADGGLLYIHDRASDFDYLQINSTTGIDIPCFQGYETIRPATMADPAGKDFSPEDFASRGISHVLVRPGLEEPEALKAWREVINDGKLHLYRNPAFQSRFVATLEDGGRAPLQPAHRTPNTMRFAMPAGAVAIDIAQPWHRKWTATLEDSSGQAPARIEKTAIGAMRIVLERPASGNSILQVRFE